jgi:hypothetical protein
MKRKIVFTILSLLLVGGIAGTFWGSSIAQAASSIWNSCPKGMVNDPYPGSCHDYIDTNKDKICDRSQPAPQTATASTATTVSASPANSSITADTSGGAGPVDTDTAAEAVGRHIYYVVPVLTGLIVLYGLTWILSVKKVFKPLTHRKIWNVILLVAVLVSALFGIILTLNIEYKTHISLPFNMLFWHVEAGIALGVVAFFHVLWHWRYFSKMLKKAEQVN